MNILEEITQAVIIGNSNDIVALTEEALTSGISAKEILNQALIPAMEQTGERMERGEVFIPEVLLSARVMQASLNILKPRLQEGKAQQRTTIVIGTVAGDLHDIGKNLVIMMLEGVGFEVIDLGKDVAPDRFVEAVKEYKPRLVGMSAMLTTTMQNMGKTINAIKDAGLRDKVKIIIGGAPVTADFSRQIDADGWAGNAHEATRVARALIES